MSIGIFKSITSLGLAVVLLASPLSAAALATSTPLSSSSKSGSSVLPIVGLGAVGLLLGLNALGLLGTTASIAASTATGISFGGIVSPPYIPCDTGLLFFVVGQLGPAKVAFFPIMWLPDSKPNSITFGAPPLPGMQILGKVLPAAIPCFIGPVFVGAGLPITPIPGFGTSIAPK